MPDVVEIDHNLNGDKFVWLWMKYVIAANDVHHCTNVLRGPYSKKLSKHNTALSFDLPVICDELPAGSFVALYICGVAKEGYAKKQNYPHNLHLPILPAPGQSSEFAFEEWRFKIRNGIVLPIIGEDELPKCYLRLPREYRTCRIFRWAMGWFRPDKLRL